MRAPVYRNIEGRNTFLGLAFPGEALAVLSAFWLLLSTFPPRYAVPLAIAIYAVVRLAGRRRAPKYLQHWLVLAFRRRFGAGRLSAIARAPSPRFPFAPHECRDVPPRPGAIADVPAGSIEPPPRAQAKTSAKRGA
jgi:hypothetical protein